MALPRIAFGPPQPGPALQHIELSMVSQRACQTLCRYPAHGPIFHPRFSIGPTAREPKPQPRRRLALPGLFLSQTVLLSGDSVPA